MINRYPYTDMHELNLDWILSKISELDGKVNNELKAYVREELNNLFLETAYDQETETLLLKITLPDESVNVNG